MSLYFNSIWHKDRVPWTSFPHTLPDLKRKVTGVVRKQKKLPPCLLFSVLETRYIPPVQHYACRNGHVEVCQNLISSGADLNAQTPGGATGLHRAAYCGQHQVVQLLVENGANGRITDNDGKTPLHKACEGGRVAVAKDIAAMFPDTVSARDKRGQLPRDLVGHWSQLWTHALGSRDQDT
jgi:hypothetical protein